MNIFKKYKLYKEYKKTVDEHMPYFNKVFQLEKNNWYELYTTISFNDVPEELVKKFGYDAVVDTEIKNYIKKFRSYLDDMNLYELYNLYEIKQLNEREFGITFGYSLMNSRSLILSKLLFIIGGSLLLGLPLLFL